MLSCASVSPLTKVSGESSLPNVYENEVSAQAGWSAAHTGSDQPGPWGHRAPPSLSQQEGGSG